MRIMKKWNVAQVVGVCLGGLLALSMAQETKSVNSWIDPNQVQGSVYPITMLVGDTLVGGCAETNPDYLTEFSLVTATEGFVSDVNTPNTWKFEYTPPEAGTYYVQMDARVIEPYEGRPVRWTVAIKVREALYPSLEWFHAALPNQSGD